VTDLRWVPVDIRASLLAACTGANGEVDVGGILRRLLLFDRYIIKSARFTELPKLVEAFGADGVANMLNRGALAIESNPVTVGEMAPLKGLALFTYQLGKIKAADYEWWLDHCLSPLRNLPNVGKFKTTKLINAVERSLKVYPASFLDKTLAATSRDVLANVPGIRRTVATELEKRLGHRITEEDLHLTVYSEGEQQLRVETNVQRLYPFRESRS